MASRKGMHIYIPKYSMAGRNCINIFIFLQIFYGLVKWNEPVIHFATVQLVTPNFQHAHFIPITVLICGTVKCADSMRRKGG